MRLIILKRKELTDRSGKTWERKGSVGQLTLDRHIVVLMASESITKRVLLVRDFDLNLGRARHGPHLPQEQAGTCAPSTGGCRGASVGHLRIRRGFCSNEASVHKWSFLTRSSNLAGSQQSYLTHLL